ncbi:addiction module RelE/StbE family toxin [Desulfitobacterium sp. LBE]|uniref:Addiction module toxin, RelE/StbE family n=1 Tax=Desulfitobacterium hafniense (strain DSM 10664 / DCB-2) TaxID=272564 RepID=B8G2G8_DESHD|nr:MULTISPECIES: type II toxin-antitoxin system RelE/ParE family toxin [Desulfitobacterium]ACL21318.1 addiction module toxin, RelE/StbE family [Desulfitobacterium hafniense DCB-2]TWH55844.1 addiction module RelE/StbE family toxin [Desulfitobacterium sp. LBE]
MKYKIRINPMAIADVQEIKTYIAEDNPEAAIQMGAVIYSKIENLADFPEMGVSLGAKINLKTDYRFLVCGAYLVFYKIEGEFVSVYRILNGARDYLTVLFSEEPSEN